LVESGRSIDEARAAVLDKLNIHQEPVTMQAADIGLSEKESRNFSFIRAINFLANPTDRSAREAAAFEIEASEAAAAKLGRQSRGITIPQDVLRRDLNVGAATAGGNLVATELDAGSFIDLLRNASALDQAGATVLTGLTGNVAIPRSPASPALLPPTGWLKAARPLRASRLLTRSAWSPVPALPTPITAAG
jgi:hypothetical protein